MARLSRLPVGSSARMTRGSWTSARATGEILRVFDDLRGMGQSLLVVTHDARVASTADVLLTMRDGAITGQTRLDGPRTAGGVASLADLGGT